MLLSLVPDNISVYNVLLDGHGKGVKEFSKTSMKKWKKQIDDISPKEILDEGLYICDKQGRAIIRLDILDTKGGIGVHPKSQGDRCGLGGCPAGTPGS